MQSKEAEVRGEFCSLNVAGLTKVKIKHFRKTFENSSVVCMQETHGEDKDKGHRIRQLGSDGGVFSLFNKAARGAAILWKAPFEKLGAE